MEIYNDVNIDHHLYNVYTKSNVRKKLPIDAKAISFKN